MFNIKNTTKKRNKIHIYFNNNKSLLDCLISINFLEEIWVVLSLLAKGCGCTGELADGRL